MAEPRDRRRSRHRAVAAAPAGDLGDHDPELDAYLAALAADDDVPGGTDRTGRFGTAQVLQVRLPALRQEQLHRLAAERGVSPAALAVEWISDRLDREDTPTGPLPQADALPQQRRRLRFGRRP